MHLFLTGGTGSIGTAILIRAMMAGHRVTTLCRSDRSAAICKATGAEVVMGDIRDPKGWAAKAAQADAVIPTADTWDDDMEAADAACLTALEAAAKASGRKLRLVYTGGCWLYGPTGDHVAVEGDHFRPQPCFRWSAMHSDRALGSDHFSAAVIHPAMVYHAAGGVFERILRAIREGEPVEVWGDTAKRWPLIHRDDLADAYLLLARQPDATGHFNAAAETGVRLGDIITAMAAHFGTAPLITTITAEEAMAAEGEWAEGATFDQQMSADRLRTELGWTPVITDYRTSDMMD